MRLIKCPACHNDISDEAQSCPKCGQPVTEKMRDPGVTEEIARNELRRNSGKRAWIVVAIIVAIVILIHFCWTSSQTDSALGGGTSGGNASKQGSMEQPQVSAASSTPSTAPIVPAHNYSYDKNGEYGYQPQLSQNQIDAGDVTAPLIMARYLGEHHGVYRVRFQKGILVAVLSCSSPCDYITEVKYVDGEFINRQVIPGNNSSIAALVMQDAMTGQLIPYDQTRTAKAAAAKRAAYEQEQKQRELRQQQEFAAQQKARQARESAEREMQQKQMKALQAQEKQSRQFEQLSNLHQNIPEWTSLIQSEKRGYRAEKRRYRAYVRNGTARAYVDPEGLLADYYSRKFSRKLSEFERNIAKHESVSASEKKALYSGARVFLKEWCQTASADPAPKNDCKIVQGYLADSRHP